MSPGLLSKPPRSNVNMVALSCDPRVPGQTKEGHHGFEINLSCLVSSRLARLSPSIKGQDSIWGLTLMMLSNPDHLPQP